MKMEPRGTPQVRLTAYHATWIACLCLILASGVVFYLTKTSIEIDSLPPVAGIFCVMAGLHFFYTRWRPEQRIGLITGGVALISLAGLTAAATALAALRTNTPLVDATVAHADRLLGLDTLEFVAWVARHPLVGAALDVVYISTVPIMFACVVILAWLRREARMWELCFTFSGTVTICAVVSIFFPVIGSFEHLRVPPDILANLPNGAGRFYMPMFEAYRSGGLDKIDLQHMQGVVQFPSFHAIMALMIAHAFRGLRGKSFVRIWCALIMISAIPIGGHYAIDLIAGSALWAAFALLAAMLAAPSAEKSGREVFDAPAANSRTARSGQPA
jgi:hypothetical protein